MTDRSDELIQQYDERVARLRKVSRMIPTSGTLTAQQRVEVAGTVKDYCQANKISLGDLARDLGTNKSYVSFMLGNKFKEMPADTLDKLLRDANNYIEYHAAEKANALPAQYFRTKVAERLLIVAKNAKKMKCMAAAHGPAGIGKTICSKAIAEEIPGSMYVCVNRGNKSPSNLERAIYECTARQKRRGMVRFEDLVSRLRGSSRLLVIDQAHRLDDKSRELLMDLHDATEIPILMVATIDIIAQISADDDAYYGQLSSRVARRANLLPEVTRPTRGGKPGRWVTVADIRKIFQRGEIRIDTDAARMLAEIASGSTGHLRKAKWLFEWAARLVEMDKSAGGVLSPQHIQAALKQVDDRESDEALAAVAEFTKQARETG